MTLQTNSPSSVKLVPDRLLVETSTGGSVERFLNVYLPSDATVGQISSTLPFVKVELDKHESVRSSLGGEAYHVKLTLAEQASPGTYKGEILCELRNMPETKVNVPLEVTILPDLVVTPRSIFLGEIRPNQTKDVKVSLRVQNGKPFLLRSVLCSNPNLKIVSTYDNVAASQKEVSIKVSTKKIHGIFGANFSMILSDGQQIGLPVMGMVTP